jgi:uncharacterized protein (TIGR02996 family)
VTDREALLRAVLTDPAADMPRLVYADWCDETGDPERGELIRVQVEAAQLGPRVIRRVAGEGKGRVPDPAVVRHAALHKRAAELLTPDNRRRWDFPPSADVRRGFVWRTRVPLRDAGAEVERLCGVFPLERVRLVATTLPDWARWGVRTERYGRYLDVATLRFHGGVDYTALDAPLAGLAQLLDARAPYLACYAPDGAPRASYASPGEATLALEVGLADWGRRAAGLPDAFVPRLVQQPVGIAAARPGQAGFADPACVFRYGGRVWCQSGTAFYRLFP